MILRKLIFYINVREYRKGQSKKDNPEKLAIQDEEKQNKKHHNIY